jgi:hypothetical protein
MKTLIELAWQYEQGGSAATARLLRAADAEIQAGRRVLEWLDSRPPRSPEPVHLLYKQARDEYDNACCGDVEKKTPD